jgi:1-acyl-sn-glycerol-3-phosphate acyltransferase
MQIVFHAPPPLNRGAILAGNHQNAVLDSITLAATSPQTPYTLSRASLFNAPGFRIFLQSLQMVPIFRFRDGFRKMRRNPEAFKQFADILGEDGWLAIFPEGSHLVRHTLRPLQKGVARIAFAAQEAEGWKREIPIVPVGFQYEDHSAFGGRLLIQYGPSISSLDLKEAHAEHSKKAERTLTDRVYEGIEPLLLIPPQDDEGYRAAVERMERNRNRFPDLMDQFRSDREVIEKGSAEGPEAAGGVGVLLRKMVGHVLCLPGRLLYLPVSLLVMGLVAASTKDPHLVPSARFLAGMFLFPIWWVGLLILLHLQYQSIPLDLTLVALLPGSLWLWSRFSHWTW